jgi:hypothetical protein
MKQPKNSNSQGLLHTITNICKQYCPPLEKVILYNGSYYSVISGGAFRIENALLTNDFITPKRVLKLKTVSLFKDEKIDRQYKSQIICLYYLYDELRKLKSNDDKYQDIFNIIIDNKKDFKEEMMRDLIYEFNNLFINKILYLTWVNETINESDWIFKK